MHILFTGSSSFTGYWFIRELVNRGHVVLATFRGNPDTYAGMRLERTRRVQALCDCVFDCSFGSDAFVDVIRSRNDWDIYCHHAAQVEGYHRPDFDVLGAVANNTRNFNEVIRALQERNCGCLLLTGSVFEADEGGGDMPLRAFSPYGLSKTLTSSYVKYFTEAGGMQCGKFVIPNPFGPYEEARFTTYLARTWLAGQVAEVRTPDYVRDNIHVELLARAYVRFLETCAGASEPQRLNPSGYVGSQREFTERFAAEMRPRLGLPCELAFARQTVFPEPAWRHNIDEVDGAEFDWDEKAAWDRLASFYREYVGDGGQKGD